MFVTIRDYISIVYFFFQVEELDQSLKGRRYHWSWLRNSHFKFRIHKWSHSSYHSKNWVSMPIFHLQSSIFDVKHFECIDKVKIYCTFLKSVNM